jgi:hypothetical protein
MMGVGSSASSVIRIVICMGTPSVLPPFAIGHGNPQQRVVSQSIATVIALLRSRPSFSKVHPLRASSARTRSATHQVQRMSRRERSRLDNLHDPPSRARRHCANLPSQPPQRARQQYQRQPDRGELPYQTLGFAPRVNAVKGVARPRCFADQAASQ